jgi:threonine dehydratase
MPVDAPTLADVRAARERLAGLVLRTPLVRLHVDDAPAEIYLKLECLQPIGSFKLRGATNAMALAGPEALRDGVYTASAGNMAQGVAWSARRLGLAATAIVPDHAPQAKLSALARLGAQVEKVPFDAWWQVLVDHGQAGRKGFFIHPVSDPSVMAGNGTIGLEILEDLPDVHTVLVPYGGGGLSCGIAAAIRGSGSRARIVACEVDTAAPLSAALAAGRPVAAPYTASFVDGIGSKGVLPEMWPLASRLLDGALSSPLDDVAAAVRLLVERAHVVSEGAGAAGVAAALSGKAGRGKTVCVVSGGNIDASVLARILSGEVP